MASGVELVPGPINGTERPLPMKSPFDSPAAAAHLENVVVDTISFSDGSKYNGTLKHGVPNGVGTCIWKDFNQYDGDWKNGLMHGFGTYLWTSGQRYDGEWKDGKRDGVGLKRYADSSTFNGFWKDGRKHGVGAFKAAEKSDKPGQGKLLPSASRRTQMLNAGESVSNIGDTNGASTSEPSAGPSDKKFVWIRAFEDGRLLREFRLSSDEIKEIFGTAWEARGSRVKKKVKEAFKIGKKLQRKQGQLLYKGMPGYDLMLKLQLGVRYSVGRVNQSGQAPPSQPAAKYSPITPQAFMDKQKIFFPSSGSSTTPAHPSTDFKWKDYCPKVFHNLRSMFGINDAEYMLSLGGSSALWQLNSPGKSGCLFFLSDDEKFLIKTMRKSEIKTLLELLPLYYKHMEGNPQCLVTRFFGVHGVKAVHGRTVRFVVMSNMFNTDLQIHRKYDLKGSTEGRTAGTVSPNDFKTVRKDLDLDIKLLMDKSAYAAVLRQVDSDAEFLRQAGVMDYSLLLGVHYCSRRKAEELGDRPSIDVQGSLAFSRSLRPMDSQGSREELSEDELTERNSNNMPGANALQMGRARSSRPDGGFPMGADDELERGEHVRNFDLFSNDREEMARMMRTFEDRMRHLNYPEQKIQDVLGLARLNILGEKLKKRSKKASKVYNSTTVLKSMQSKRHDPELRIEEDGDTGPSDEDAPDSPRGDSPGPGAKPQLGVHMRALALPTGNSTDQPEEVILYFGIIDILQEYNTRKVVERRFKSVVHDGYAISVAPPKLYARRFVEFMHQNVFLDPQQPGLGPAGHSGVARIEEETEAENGHQQ